MKKTCGCGGTCFHGWQYDAANRIMRDARICGHGRGHGISEHLQIRNAIADALLAERRRGRRKKA